MSKSGPDTPSQDQSNNLDTERRPRADCDRLFALATQAAERSPDRQFALVTEQQWDGLVNDFDRNEWTWG
ncbi:MAG: hypothetical protein LRY49_11805 [Burkholderiaceae bacterium]|nr:hypothetical protein [Burkholderiaceae bacterium]